MYKSFPYLIPLYRGVDWLDNNENILLALYNKKTTYHILGVDNYN